MFAAEAHRKGKRGSINFVYDKALQMKLRHNHRNLCIQVHSTHDSNANWIMMINALNLFRLFFFQVPFEDIT